MKDTNYFEKALSYGIQRKALLRCCRNVRWKDSVVAYEHHALQHTLQLIENIKNKSYKISKYQRFIIHEPKEREIVATRLVDRQFQMAVCMGGLYLDFTEHFIHDNCACQVGKGTDFCLKRVKKHMCDFYRKYKTGGWVLKMDIHHFFPSTRHDVAKEAVRKRIGDPRACEMVCDVIDSFGGDVGIGLGSQISQLVELSVLDDLDHFIKERLRIEHYVRYMDDLVLIHEDKEYLQYCWKEIEKQLNAIGLKLNRKTTMYPVKQGVKMLKWRFYYTETGRIIMVMERRKLGKQRRRLKKLLRKEMTGEYLPGTALTSLTAWLANAARGDTYYQRRRMKFYYYTIKAGIENEYHQRRAAA